MTKWIIGLGVLVIVGVGVWWTGLLNPFFASQAPTDQQATTTPQVQEQQPPVSDLPTQSSDTSDGALVQDSAAVDTQLQALSSDQSNIDSSMNDKPVSQEF
jgi:cytoskeletal protein RodZ